MNATNGRKAFFGKYRGSVVSNVDPYKLGRLQVLVPEVADGVLKSWAMPCVPIGGMQTGMYLVPPPQAGVWIEFEHGDPDYPVWVGSYWGTAAEVPSSALPVPPGVPVIVLQTPAQNAIVISDVPVPPLLQAGGVVMKSGVSMIAVEPTGVRIMGPKVEIDGLPVIINKGGLQVL